MKTPENNERGRELTQRVMRRYRNRSPLTDAIANVLTFVAGLSCLMAVVLFLGQVVAITKGPAMVVGAVIGVAVVLLLAIANYNDRFLRLWQKSRTGPIQRRRRSWLRWLTGAVTCGYCRDDLGDETTDCPACHAGYHRECADELGRCGTIGCEGLGVHAPRKASKGKVALHAPQELA